MPNLTEILGAFPRAGNHRPWPRYVVDEDAWRALTAELAAGKISLLGLWGDADAVHMAVLDREPFSVAIASLGCQDRCFPSVGRLHAPAIRFERTIWDLFGYRAVGAATRGLGLIMAVGRSARLWAQKIRRLPFRLLIISCRASAQACTRFPSARSMPGSSNRDISALPQAAKRSCGWRSGLATPTRAWKD